MGQAGRHAGRTLSPRPSLLVGGVPLRWAGGSTREGEEEEGYPGLPWPEARPSEGKWGPVGRAWGRAEVSWGTAA